MDHIWFKCEQPCEKPNCNYCDGGLKTCTVCGASESELPIHCPGRKLTNDEKEQISRGYLGFRYGRWEFQEDLRI